MPRKKKVTVPAVEETKKPAASNKTTAKKEAEVKVEAAKVEEAKVEEVKIEETAAPQPEKKTRRTRKPAMKSTVTVEFAGSQTIVEDILAKAEAAYMSTHEDAVIKTLDVYIKPEEKVAYYVVNGEGSEDFKVSL
ncbi:MAG: DUF6465 family protein [Lachnospiraceae bacterium]|nr:DUF6465 family protein [Lachnospiraceae bacterium]